METHHPVARAFELAKSGKFRSLKEIERAMLKEGYSAVLGHLDSPSLRKQLIAMIRSQAKSSD